MKKTLAILLAALMVFACFPMMVFADDTTETYWTENKTIFEDEDFVIPANEIVRVSAGVTDITVEGSLTVNGTLSLPAGAKMTVNGTLTVNGVIYNGGEIYNNNRVVGKTNIRSDESAGVLLHHVEVPTPPRSEYHLFVADKDEVYNANSLAKLYTGDNGSLSTAAYFGAVDEAFDGYIKDGNSLFFTLTFDDPSVDPYKFDVNQNHVGKVNRFRDVYEIKVDQYATSVSYGAYDAAALIKEITIALPAGKGYKVVAHGTTLDQAVTESIDAITVNYGQDLYIRVEILDGYHANVLTVTAGGVKLVEDEYGYFVIRNITSTDPDDYKIVVQGIMSNATTDSINGILDMVRRVFATIVEVFNTISSMFRGIFSF